MRRELRMRTMFTVAQVMGVGHVGTRVWSRDSSPETERHVIHLLKTRTTCAAVKLF